MNAKTKPPSNVKPKKIAPISPDNAISVSNIAEKGGYKGQEPTIFGDWQHKGRVTDF